MPQFFSKLFGKDPRVLVSAARSGDYYEVERLLDEGWDIEGCDSDGWKASHQAAFRGHTAVVKVLIRRGIKVDARTQGGETSLMLAAWKGHNDVIELLVKHNADVHITDNYDRGAIHRAAFNGRAKTVEFLHDHHANVNLADRWGDTALHDAACRSHFYTVFVLVQNHIDVFHENKDGKTAVQCVGTDKDHECDLCCDCQQTTKLLQLSEIHFNRIMKKIKDSHMEGEMFHKSYPAYIRDIYQAVRTSPADLDVSEVGDRLALKWDIPVNMPPPPQPRPPSDKDGLVRVDAFIDLADPTHVHVPSYQLDGSPPVLKSYKEVNDANQVRQIPAGLVLPAIAVTPPPNTAATSIVGPPTELQLSDLVYKIGWEWTRLALQLGLRQSRVEHFEMAHPGQPERWIMSMLMEWRARVQGETPDDRRRLLVCALKAVKRNDLAAEFE